MTRTFAAACLLVLLAACGRVPAPATEPASPAAAVPAPPATPAPAAAPTDAWALPGTLHPRTSEADLRTRFGAANVKRETLPGAEGIGQYPLLVVYPDDPRRRLELVMDEGQPGRPIQTLRIAGTGSLWHAGGIRLGMPLAELVALNGAPVGFYGLSWDYGGTVADWHGGKLAPAEGLPPAYGVVLGTRDGDDGDGLPMGDAQFRSDDPRWPGIGERLVVRELSVGWPDERGD